MIIALETVGILLAFLVASMLADRLLGAIIADSITNNYNTKRLLNGIKKGILIVVAIVLLVIVCRYFPWFVGEGHLGLIDQELLDPISDLAVLSIIAWPTVTYTTDALKKLKEVL